MGTPPSDRQDILRDGSKPADSFHRSDPPLCLQARVLAAGWETFGGNRLAVTLISGRFAAERRASPGDPANGDSDDEHQEGSHGQGLPPWEALPPHKRLMED